MLFSRKKALVWDEHELHTLIKNNGTIGTAPLLVPIMEDSDRLEFLPHKLQYKCMMYLYCSSRCRRFQYTDRILDRQKRRNTKNNRLVDRNPDEIYGGMDTSVSYHIRNIYIPISTATWILFIALLARNIQSFPLKEVGYTAVSWKKLH